jgi:hypothetical protein
MKIRYVTMYLPTLHRSRSPASSLPAYYYSALFPVPTYIMQMRPRRLIIIITSGPPLSIQSKKYVPLYLRALPVPVRCHTS